jgi:hypothetical protein
MYGIDAVGQRAFEPAQGKLGVDNLLRPGLKWPGCPCGSGVKRYSRLAETRGRAFARTDARMMPFKFACVIAIC